jgi:hypothetical protein
MMGCFSNGTYSSPAKAKSIFDGRRQATDRPLSRQSKTGQQAAYRQMNGVAAVQPSNVKKSSCIDLLDKNTKRKVAAFSC